MQMTLSTVAHHEAGHLIGCLAIERKIAVIRVEDDLSGHCLLCEGNKRAHVPVWDSLMAACEVASDLAGVVAAARL